MKEQLEKLKQEYNKFKIDNDNIFKINKEFLSNIKKLEKSIREEIELNKPKFPFPDLNPDSFEELSYEYGFDGTITEEAINKLNNDYYKDQLRKVIGWKTKFESSGNFAVNDSDYYEVSIELTDTDGNVYSVTDQTCLAVGYNFGDKRFS